MKIPNDIKKFVMKKRLAVIIKFLIFTLIATLIFVVFGDKIFLSWAKNIKYVVYAALIIYFAFSTKLIKIILDRSYQGTIADIKIKETTVMSKDYYPNFIALSQTVFPNSIFRRYTFYASIVMDNGKTKKKKLYSISMKNRADLDDFLVGDTVIYIAGTNYFEVIRPKKEAKNCVICGTENPSPNEKCQICGYNLLNYEK